MILALWIVSVALGITLAYGILRLRQIDETMEQATQNISGLASDIVALAFTIRVLADEKHEEATEESA